MKAHFGAAEDTKPEWFKLDACFKMDEGTGRIPGLRVFGPPEAATVWRPMLAQVADHGAVGASANGNRFLGCDGPCIVQQRGLAGH